MRGPFFYIENHNMTTSHFPADQIARNNSFFDKIMRLQGFKNDAALSRGLEVAPPVVSKIRHGNLLIGPGLMIRAHELTGMPFSEIRDYIPKAA